MILTFSIKMANSSSLKNQLNHLLSYIKNEFPKREGDTASIAVRQKNSNFPDGSTIDVLAEIGYTITATLKNPVFQLRFIINGASDTDFIFEMQLFQNGTKDDSYFEEFFVSGKEIPNMIKEWDVAL
jgi:hypothetical protein